MSYQQQEVPPPYQAAPAPQYQQAPPPVAPQYQPPSAAPQYQQAPPPIAQPVTYSTTVTVTEPLIGHAHWGEIPQRHHCQFCGKDIVTDVQYEPGTLTWLVAGGLILLGCWLGCCLIPFCVDGAKDVIHVCPHCHNVCGKKSRI